MLCIVLILFLPLCIYWDRGIVICFKEVLKDPNVNLIIEQFKLECLCFLKSKEASGTSQTKTKLGKLLHLNVDPA